VRELVRVGAGSSVAVETLNGANMIRLRDRLLPVIALTEVLNTAPHTSAEEMTGYVIVLEAAGRKIGLVVDDVLDTEEIVVKPLSGPLRSINVFSGATILGDGSVIMILDPNGLAQETASAEDEEKSEAASEEAAAAEAANGRQRLLLVRAGGEEPKAVPVSLITRLEDFESSTIEQTDGRYVVQYRGRLCLWPMQAAWTPSRPKGASRCWCSPKTAARRAWPWTKSSMWWKSVSTWKWAPSVPA
jgi:two-component system chemotaxis sensor kinase CheA